MNKIMKYSLVINDEGEISVRCFLVSEKTVAGLYTINMALTRN